jgi:hypothetical protein
LGENVKENEVISKYVGSVGLAEIKERQKPHPFQLFLHDADDC